MWMTFFTPTLHYHYWIRNNSPWTSHIRVIFHTTMLGIHFFLALENEKKNFKVNFFSKIKVLAWVILNIRK